MLRVVTLGRPRTTALECLGWVNFEAGRTVSPQGAADASVPWAVRPFRQLVSGCPAQEAQSGYREFPLFQELVGFLIPYPACPVLDL